MSDNVSLAGFVSGQRYDYSTAAIRPREIDRD